MKAKKIVLKNGLEVFLIKIAAVKTVTTLAMFKTGSKYESREISGLSHFLEHMFFKGTEKRPDTLSLSSELDSIGAEFNAFTGKEYTGYYIKSAKNKINVSLDVLSDMLINSKFDVQEIEREKGVIIEEMNMYKDNPMMHIEDVFERCLYGDTPAGWDVIGFKDTVLNLQRDDFLKYFKNQYGTKSMALFVAGNFSEKEIKKTLEEKFSDIKKNPYQSKKPVAENQKRPTYIIEKKKTDQITLSLGFRAFSAKHKDNFALKLLSVILGGSMSSRLFIELRERRGLAYYVRSSIESYSDSGYITVQAGIPKNKLEESLKVILLEYEKLKQELVSEKELKRAKDLLSGKIIVKMEGTDDFSSWYARQFALSEKFLSPNEFLKNIKRVSAADIKRLAEKLFVSHNLNLALIADIKNEESIKKILKIK